MQIIALISAIVAVLGIGAFVGVLLTVAFGARVALAYAAHRGRRGDDTAEPEPPLVWWLDDGESHEPDLYASHADGIGAAMKQFKDDNPGSRAALTWRVPEPDDECSPDDVDFPDLELLANEHRTGIFVRARRPKTAPAIDAMAAG